MELRFKKISDGRGEEEDSEIEGTGKKMLRKKIWKKDKLCRRKIETQ